MKTVIVCNYGSIAKVLSESLILLGHSVRIIIPSALVEISGIVDDRIDFRTADPLLTDSYGSLLKGADVLFDLGAEGASEYSSGSDEALLVFSPVKKLLDAAVEQKIACIVQLSSVAVLEKPRHKSLVKEYQPALKDIDPYITGRMMVEAYADKLIKERNVDIRRVYASHMPGTSVDNIGLPIELFDNYLKGARFFYLSGGISLTTIGAVASALLNTWLKGKAKTQYIVAGYNISYQEFFIKLSERCDRPRPFCPFPGFIKNFPWEPKAIALFFSHTNGYYNWYSSTRAIRDLGYKLTPPSQIIKEALSKNQDDENI